MKEFLQTDSKEHEAERFQLRLGRLQTLRWVSLTVTGIVILALGGYYYVWPKILNWRQNRDLESVAIYEKQGDYRSAQLMLEQVVQARPQSMEAKRRLADFYERTGQRQALDLWKEIARLEPNVPENLLGWAGAALRFKDVGTVRTVLQQVRQSGHTDADFYRLSAGLALMNRDPGALEENLAELARLQPEDLRVRLNLAIARLQDPENPRAADARTALIGLARSDTVRIRAIVELVNDIARRWPKPAVERTAAFQHLVLEITPPKGPRLDPPEIGDPLEQLLGFAMLQPAPSADDTAILLNLMILNGRSAAAFEWIEALPLKTRSATPVLVVSAEAALRSNDLPRLRRTLLAGAWGLVPITAVDQAIKAREGHDRTTSSAEHSPWSRAVDACAASLPGMRMLVRLSEAWQWPEERRQVLLATTRAFPREGWAWRQLISYALARRDSEQLGQTYQRWSRAVSGDTGIQVEAAIIGLLLQQRGAPRVRDTAEYYRLQPGNPGASVAHALALWREKRTAEALLLLDALPAGAYAEPRFALVYGLLLADAGRVSASEKMLDRATADRLLPEELLLVEQARARNHQRLALPRNH